MANLSKNDYMRQVVEFAKTIDPVEVPVAAFIVKDNEIIARALNTREKTQDVFGHAELNVIKIAQKKLNSWNLAKCQIYVSLEPCVMCAGAIAQSHIQEIYFAAYDYKFGACGSKFMVFPNTTKIQGGILEDQAKKLLEDFFKNKR